MKTCFHLTAAYVGLPIFIAVIAISMKTCNPKFLFSVIKQLLWGMKSVMEYFIRRKFGFILVQSEGEKVDQVLWNMGKKGSFFFFVVFFLFLVLLWGLLCCCPFRFVCLFVLFWDTRRQFVLEKVPLDKLHDPLNNSGGLFVCLCSWGEGNWVWVFFLLRSITFVDRNTFPTRIC